MLKSWYCLFRVLMFISLRVVAQLLEMRELLVSLTLLHSMFLNVLINSCYLFNNIFFLKKKPSYG